MKRFIVFLVSLCIYVNIYSQARIGSSLDEIKNEFTNNDMRYSIIEKIPCLIVIYSNVDVFYYLNNAGFCYQTSIVTKNLTLAKNIIDIYNKNYIIKSRISWIMNNNFRIVTIQFQYITGIGYIFTWK